MYDIHVNVLLLTVVFLFVWIFEIFWCVSGFHLRPVTRYELSRARTWNITLSLISWYISVTYLIIIYLAVTPKPFLDPVRARRWADLSTTIVLSVFHFFVELIVNFTWVEKILGGRTKVMHFHRIKPTSIVKKRNAFSPNAVNQRKSVRQM